MQSIESPNPLNPHNALKHHFANEIVLKITVYVFIYHPLQVIFIHYKSRIATAIRGL